MLPFILGGIALAAAGFGVKKGVDAVDDNNTAEKYQRWAREEAEEANQNLETCRKDTDSFLENYGKTKKENVERIGLFQDHICYSDNIKSHQPKLHTKKKNYFVITKEEEIKILQELGVISSNVPLSVAKEQVQVGHQEISMLTDAVGGIAGGSLAGFAAGGASYLGVSALGTASTGTAIGSLSGAAATNATLAWLGGGSLASGGLGIAGGMAVMGGLVAGPAIAIAGAVMASKAEENKSKAWEKLTEVRANIKKLDVVISKLKSIQDYTNECNWVCQKLLQYWTPVLTLFISEIADRGLHYHSLPDAYKELVRLNYNLAYLLKDFVIEPILLEDGELLPPSERKALLNARMKIDWTNIR